MPPDVIYPIENTCVHVDPYTGELSYYSPDDDGECEGEDPQIIICAGEMFGIMGPTQMRRNDDITLTISTIDYGYTWYLDEGSTGYTIEGNGTSAILRTDETACDGVTIHAINACGDIGTHWVEIYADDMAVYGAETMDPSDTEIYAAAGASGWYSFSISGTGFSVPENSVGISVVVTTTSDACGVGMLTVMDGCGQVATKDIRCTAGQWVLTDPQACVIPDAPITGSLSSITIDGKYKQSMTQRTFFNGGGNFSSEDTTCAAVLAANLALANCPTGNPQCNPDALLGCACALFPDEDGFQTVARNTFWKCELTSPPYRYSYQLVGRCVAILQSWEWTC